MRHLRARRSASGGSSRGEIDPGRARLTLQAPFPWFGGKRRVARVVWERFGPDVGNYVEPFFGSGAVLLGRPRHRTQMETVNDKDGYVANFWRAIKAAPDDVAEWADWPVNENDLHARHVWLRTRNLVPRLEGDPEFFDAKIAGWWVWGMACWIGGGFCGSSGSGPWGVLDGQLVHLRNAGEGVARKRVHLGDAGRGVSRKRVHLGDAGQGVARKERAHALREWFGTLADRLARVRVCCGDWSRVTGPTVTYKNGTTAVFLDPPYSADAGRDMALYAQDSPDVAHKCREWAIAEGDNPLMRIALCGYADEGHDVLRERGWSIHKWTAHGGYASLGDGKNKNRARERIWFSPHCLSLQEGLGL